MFFDKENQRNSDHSLILRKKLDSKETPQSLPSNNEEDITPTLICEKFQAAVWVGFGCVPLNTPSVRMFHLTNPSNSSSVKVSVEKCPTRKGFSISLSSSNPETIIVAANQTLSGYVHWTPRESMSVREVAVLLLDDKHRLQLTLHGVAGMGTSKVLIGTKKTTKSNDENKFAVHKVTKKSEVLKPNLLLKSGDKSHSTNNKISQKTTNSRTECQKVIKTDRDKCINKQVSTLTEWINSKLRQQKAETDNYCDQEDSEQGDVEGRYRHDFEAILNDEDTASVLRQVRAEVYTDKLTLRRDTNVRANVSFKDGIMNLLMCYDPTWLRPGLEAYFNVTLLPSPPAKHVPADSAGKKSERKVASDVWAASLRKLILDRVLQSEEIHVLHTTNKEGATVAMTPAVEKKYQDDLRQHILLSVLSIIYLLDEARMNGMCNGQLMLFRPDSAVKTSKEMIAELSRNFLQGEGDVFKHLASLGYNVEFSQTSFHEFNFQIVDISEDLKDGVRLARLVDLLSPSDQQQNTPSSLLRIPAVSRLQKLYNIGVSLKYLRSKGIEIPVEEKLIADGNQEATMLLLWSLLFEFELKFVVSVDDIKSEVLKIEIAKEERLEKYSSKCSNEALFSQLQALLLHWCDSIAKIYLQNLHNLSDSIMDGRVLCLLVHHYHPNILPVQLIKDNSEYNNEYANNTKPIIYSLSSLSQTNRNVTRRSNYLNLAKALRVIGGVPFVLSDETVTDERTMVMFLGFLFSRLVVNTSKQATAVSLVQLSDRSKKCYFSSSHNEANVDVAITIYSSSRQSASSVIGKCARNYLLRQKEIKKSILNKLSDDNKEVESSTARLTAFMTAELEDIEEYTQTHVEIPETEEAIRDKNDFVEILNDVLHAEIPIVSSENENLERYEDKQAIEKIEVVNMLKICMTELLFKFKSGVALKTETLGRLSAEQKLDELRRFHEASMQSALKKQQELEARLVFELKEKDRFRIEIEISNTEEVIRVAEEKLLRSSKEYFAANTLQRFGNRVLYKRQFRLAVLAAVKLQSFVRSTLSKNRFLSVKEKIVIIQKRVRVKQAKVRYDLKCQKSMKTISRWYAKLVSKERNAKQLKALVTIQRFYAFKLVERMFKIKRKAIHRIQRAWRSYKISSVQEEKRAACVIQTLFIKHVHTKKSIRHHSAIVLQSYFRRCIDKLAKLKRIQRANDLQASMMICAKLKIVRFFKRIIMYKNKQRAALYIEKWFQSYLPLLRSRKLIRGFRRLQAFRRSIAVRRSQSEKIRVIYDRIKLANAHALSNPEMKLSFLTQTALQTLQKGKMISHVLKACQTLELSTSYSVSCCKNFVAASASKILFALIRSCNRSTPHQELLRCALTVLINVTKDENLAAKVVHNGDTTELLVDLMQMFRDKKIIFNLSCELMTRFISAQSEIMAECIAPDMKKRLDGILHILERKHRLDLKVKNISKTGTSKASPKSSPDFMSTAAPFELMKTFMEQLEKK